MDEQIEGPKVRNQGQEESSQGHAMVAVGEACHDFCKGHEPETFTPGLALYLAQEKSEK